MARAGMSAPAAEAPVAIFIPKVSGEEPQVYVGVCGRGYIIRRGVRAEVPPIVAELLQQSEQAKLAAEAYEEAEQRKLSVVQGAPV